MNIILKNIKLFRFTSLVFVFSFFVLAISQADELFEIPEVELPPDIEAYFSLAIELEIKDYRARREIKKKVVRPLKKFAAEYLDIEEYKEAENIYLRLIEITQRVYGAGHRDTEYFMSKLSWLYSKSKQFSKRVAMLQKLLDIRKQRVGEYHMTIAKEMKTLANAYKQMGAYSKSIAAYKHIFKIYEENDYRYEDNFRIYSPILYKLASVYIELGEYAKAEPYYERSLPPLNGPLEKISHLSMVRLHSYVFILHITGKYQEAETLYLKVLKYTKGKYKNNSMQMATVLALLGSMYSQLGAYDKALKAKKDSLAIFKKIFGEASTITAFGMNNLAETYIAVGQYNEALSLLKTSTALLENMQFNIPVELRIDKNLALLNLGLVNMKLKKMDRAESIYRQVLSDNLDKYPAYHPIIANTEIKLAEVLLEKKEYSKAADYALNALAIANSKSSPYLLINCYSILAKIRQGQQRTAEAIFYGKQAVNSLQTVRGGLVNSEKSLQKAFVASQQSNYEILAGWLIDTGRLSEAEQVLVMLKEDEYFNFIRRNNNQDPRLTQSILNKLESLHIKKLNAASKKSIVLDKQLKKLEYIKKQYLTKKQKLQIVKLKDELVLAQQQFKKVLVDINTTFGKEKKHISFDVNRQNQNYLSFFNNAGKDVAIVYFLQLDDSLRIIVRTSEGEISKKIVVSKKELQQNIWDVKNQFTRPDKKFISTAKKLYQWLITPIETHLNQQGIKTLLVYKKGTLRYIPLAALYDGKQFLIEKYAISHYDASLKALNKNNKLWNIAGMGVSKQLGKFEPLPMVPFELDSIIKRDKQDAVGVFNGQIYMDEAFTQNRFKSLLNRNFNIGHIATHYEFKSGTDADSFLLLGDGSKLDLGTIRRDKYNFSRIELLTLSACETAVNDRYADGREIEGLATLVQRQGAKGVLASLWKVADCSTGKLMQLFYQYRQQGMSKARALRQSQLDFIQGKVAALKVSKDHSRGCQPISGLENSGSAYKHPYYWAPFILMGNWQ